MKNYSQYQLEDFLTDESFRNWILSGGEADAGGVWSQRLSHYPSLREDAQRAREIILATTLKEEPFAEGYFEAISQGTLAAIRDQKQPRPLWTWRVAAAVVLLVGLGVWAVWNQKQVTTPAGEQLASTPVEPVRLEKDNPTNAIVPVALPDGSSILLHPGSSLTYSHVPGQNREVHLVGKAFFEVVKDPRQPFVVHSGELVTRVVGTSFTITAYSGDTDYSVVVKTGKVAVSAAPSETGKEASVTTTFNLVPNEKLVFNREKALFKRLDINSREILNYVPTIEASYKFEDTPVATVFQQIGKSYGLKIDMEESLFAGCELTSNLTDEPLFEKLNIVCNAVGPGTSYVVEEGRIRIISKGCNL